MQVYNSKGETLNTAEAGGTLSASPGGTFQIAFDKAHQEETEMTEETAETEMTEETAVDAEWHTDPGNVTVTEDHFWLHGHLNATVPALGAELTCDITAHITINNGGGHANVEIDEVVLDAPAAGCHGVFGGALTCEITGGLAGAGEVHISGTSLAITNAFFLTVLEGMPGNRRSRCERHPDRFIQQRD